MTRRTLRSRREWVSTAERERLRLAPGQTESCDRTVSISDALEGILADVKLVEEHWLNRLRDGWQSVAGDVAQHTVPGRVEKGCLFVYVDSSVWLAELSRYGKKALLERIHKAGFKDKVKSVCFQIGS